MLDKYKIRHMVDTLGMSSYLDSDGDIVITYFPDEDFGHRVNITLITEPHRLSILGAAPDYTPKGDPLFLANFNNSARNYPTAVVRNGRIQMEYSIFISEDVSDAFIRDSYLMNVIPSVWHAFIEMEEFDNK